MISQYTCNSAAAPPHWRLVHHDQPTPPSTTHARATLHVTAHTWPRWPRSCSHPPSHTVTQGCTATQAQGRQSHSPSCVCQPQSSIASCDSTAATSLIARMPYHHRCQQNPYLQAHACVYESCFVPRHASHCARPCLSLHQFWQPKHHCLPSVPIFGLCRHSMHCWAWPGSDRLLKQSVHPLPGCAAAAEHL